MTEEKKRNLKITKTEGKKNYTLRNKTIANCHDGKSQFSPGKFPNVFVTIFGNIFMGFYQV